MIALLLLLAVAEVTEVRLDRGGWIIDTPRESGPLPPGESTWRWSERCAPEKVEGKAPSDCRPVRKVSVSVTDASERVVANAHVVWATEAMLEDLPDHVLPRGTSAEDGTVTLALPVETAWVRVAGPQYATAWRRVNRGEASLRLQARRRSEARLVLASKDGKPFVRARVAVLPPSSNVIGVDRLLAFTDGKAPLDLHAPYGLTARLIVWSDSHAPVSRLVTFEDRDVTTTLEPGSTLRVRLRDIDKKPIRSGSLETQYALPGLRLAVRRAAAAGVDGLAELGGLPAAVIEWTATAPAFARRVASTTIVAGENDLIEVTMLPARRLRVTVTDAFGAPIRGARVVITGSSSATTQADGTAVLTEVAAEESHLEISAAGFLPQSATVAAEAKELAVTLSRGSGIKASVVRESDGLVPQSVQVRITNNGAESARTLEVQGDVVVAGLKPGSLRVRIAAEGVQTFDSGTVQVEENAIRDLGLVVLKKGLVVRGRVVDERGDAVADARVRLLRLDGESPAIANLFGDWTNATLTPDGAFELASLRAGRQFIVIEASGYASAVLNDVEIDERQPEVDVGAIRLERGTTLRIVCRPVRRCGSSAEVMLAGPEFPFLAVRGSLQDGVARIMPLPSGRSTLRLLRGQQIVHEMTVDVRATVDPQTVEIDLLTVRVDGSVTIGRSPARGGTVVLSRSVKGGGVPILLGSRTANGSELSREWIGSFGGVVTALVDDKGRFVFEELEEGEWLAIYRTAASETREIRVTVTSVPQQRLRLDFEGHLIEGEVVDRDDRPLVAAIQAKDAVGAVHTSTSGRDGRFSILGLSGGRATVRATAGRRSAATQVEAGSAAARSMTIRLSEESDALAVTVIDAEGKPVRGALVFALASGRAFVASADGEGVATFPALEAGTAVIAAAHRPARDWAFSSAGAAAAPRVGFSARNGSISLRSATQGAVSIVTPQGFPLEQVLAMTGIVPQVTAGGLLTLTGLPEGTYSVGVGAARTSATVRANETTLVSLN